MCNALLDVVMCLKYIPEYDVKHQSDTWSKHVIKNKHTNKL